MYPEREKAQVPKAALSDVLGLDYINRLLENTRAQSQCFNSFKELSLSTALPRCGHSTRAPSNQKAALVHIYPMASRAV